MATVRVSAKTLIATLFSRIRYGVIAGLCVSDDEARRKLRVTLQIPDRLATRVKAANCSDVE